MKLRHTLALSALASAATLGCADETTPTTEKTENSREVPSRPEGAAAGDGPGATFALTHYFVGTRTREGQPSSEAWKEYGYNRDGVITRNDFDRDCRPAGGAPPNNIFPDGDGGVDNAFGKILLPLLQFVSGDELIFGEEATKRPDVEDFVNAKLGGATSGLLIHVRDLGTRASYDPVDAFVYGARANADGTWSVKAESVDDPDATLDGALRSGRVHFPWAYVTDDVWVGLPESDEDVVLELTWDVDGFVVPLRLHRPIVTMRMSPAHEVAGAGVVSGILRTDEVIEWTRRALVRIDPSFCDGAAIDGILNQMRQASDIMVSGEQEPGATCDGISIGFSFEATLATVTGVADPEPAAAETCPE